MSGKEKFWLEDPCILLTNIRLFPTSDMTKDEKLNALTRASIAISAGMYFMENEYWFTFLIVSILAIVILKYNGKKDDGKDKEDFTLVPTYANPNLETTTIAPLFAEEWQMYPPVYDEYVNTPPDVSFAEPLQPQQYPYGQYLTRTNLLPSDEYATHMLNGGPKQAREYVNGAFMRHEMSFRENMTRLYKKKLARRFRNNANDTFSPFESY